MANIAVKLCVGISLACGLGLTLGACSSSSNFVADNWPHFAGGEPNDVPPRPGSPGYKKFIEHGQPPEAASTPEGASMSVNGQGPTAGVAPEFAARQSGGSAQRTPVGAPAPAPGPVGAAPPPRTTDQNVGQGGLY